MPELSVIIAARCEEWLARTVTDVLANARRDTEVVVVIDGESAGPPVPDDPRVTVIELPQPIGQRAAVNLAARLSTATYVMKLDAHCRMDEGFDAKLIAADEEIGRDDLTQIPTMLNLHAFDWRCTACGLQTYQGPTPEKCNVCQSTGPFERVVYFDLESQAPHGRGHVMHTHFWAFDQDMHFQYWHRYKRRPEAKGDLVDVMSSIGACVFMRRARFWQLGGLDEQHGSWGQFGTELACKSWLSGGRHVVNNRTWFAHLFRTQGGPYPKGDSRNFGFPYNNSGRGRLRAQAYSKDLWWHNKWPGQVLPLSWLIDKFAPVTGLTGGAVGWHEPQAAQRLAEVQAAGALFVQRRAAIVRMPTAGCVYYTDLRLDPRIQTAVQRQLARSVNGHPIVAVALGPVNFGHQQIVLPLERGRLTMFKQILAGLEALDTDIAFLVEHDVLYNASHFQFMPADRNVFYYNENTWRVDAKTGHALYYRCRQVSGLCAYRETLIDHYQKRIALMDAAGGAYDHKIGYEPGTRSSIKIDNRTSAAWMSEQPLIDIRHGCNLTKSRWSQDQFRDKTTCQEWQESDSVPGWGKTEGVFEQLLARVRETDHCG